MWYEVCKSIVCIIAGVCGGFAALYGTYTYNEPPPNMDGPYLLGTIATLHCEVGHHLHNWPNLTCVIWRTGTWFWVPTDGSINWPTCRGDD